MKRGSRFFTAFTEGEETKKEAGGRGRSRVLIEQRNKKFFYRYYYYSKILHWRFPNVITAIGDEFDLSESTVGQLIGDNIDRIKKIGEEKLTRGQLKNMYPQYNWNDKEIIQVVQKRDMHTEY